YVSDVAFNFVERRFRLFIELLIFRRLLYAGLVFPRFGSQTSQVRGVAADEFALDWSPRSLAKALVVQGPAGGQHQQDCADKEDRTGRSAHDRIALRLCVFFYQRFDAISRFGHSL